MCCLECALPFYTNIACLSYKYLYMLMLFDSNKCLVDIAVKTSYGFADSQVLWNNSSA